MPSIRAAACALFLLAASLPAQSPVLTPDHMVYPAGMDTTCRPCKDFFRFANGKWLAAAEVPSAATSVGLIPTLRSRNAIVVRQLLERRSDEAGSTPDADRVRRFYASCMDTGSLAKAENTVVRSRLAAIHAIRDLDGLFDQVASLHLFGVSPYFSYESMRDPTNPSTVMLTLSQSGLSLPARFYTSSNAPMVAGLKTLESSVQRYLALAGIDSGAAAGMASDVLMVERALATVRMPQSEDESTVFKVPVSGRGAFTRVRLDRWLRGVGASDVDSVNLAYPDFFTRVDSLLGALPLKAHRAYLAWHFLRFAAPHLGPRFSPEVVVLDRITRGTSVLPERYTTCVRLSESLLAGAVGALYTAEFFGDVAQARMQEMIDNLYSAFRARLTTADWMSDSTRRGALAKLSIMRARIGGPPRGTEVAYDGLEIRGQGFLSDLIAASTFRTQREMKTIGRAYNREEWPPWVPPSIVNAAFNEFANEIYFPAGLLQPPLFDPAADDAVNYGAIGSAIGHEIMHAFDASGCKRDGEGRLRNWCTEEDARKFAAQAERLVTQFNGYVAVDTLHVDGRLTLGENMADLAGVEIAYAALQLSLAKHGRPSPIDGFSAEQRFFLAYAGVYRTKTRLETARASALTDSHAPGEFRVNGILQHFPAFAAAFGCTMGDSLFRTADQRVRIF